MAAFRPSVRHELKYYINYGEYTHLSRTLDYLLSRDPSGDEYNEYAVRSLYFDTINDDFLDEKIAGVGNRKKYRIRIYKYADTQIKLECKSKYGNLISKQSVSIPRDLAEQIIACDPTGLEKTSVPLLHDVFREMKLRLLRPVVIVDYIREAYIHPAEEVRITFDKKLRTGLYQTDMFNPAIPTIPVFDNNVMVLEVKFNRVLPDFLQLILSSARGDYCAISKYVACRRYEEKEY